MEAIDLGALPASEVTHLVSEAYAVRVLDALHDNATPAVRQHDGVHLVQ
ncbi:MAG: hypothetical protein ACRDNZ_09510 [Streptosporangiaceae bacterium]